MPETVIGPPCKRGHTLRYTRSGKCIECNQTRVKAWREKNPDYQAQWARTHREKRREYTRKYCRDNKELRRERWLSNPTNAEKQRATQSRYRKRNPDKTREHFAARRARILGAPGNGVTSPQWKQILADSLGLCAYCNECRKLTPDHIEPLVRGGSHDIDNIAAVCWPCNARKHDIPLLVWLARKREGGRAKHTPIRRSA